MDEGKRLIDAAVAKRIMDDCVLWETDEVETAKTCIDLTPTVDAVEVVHAKWEWIDEEECGIYRCSCCCGAVGYPTDYCPNCGAKMDGGDMNA